MKINQLHEDHYSTMEPGKRIDQEKKDRELGIGHDWELKPGDTQPTYIGDLANHPDLQPQTDFITDIPANKGEEPNPYIEKLKDLGGWYLDTVIDAGKSIGRGIKSQVTGVKDFGKRRWDSFQQDVVNDDINRLRTLSGLMEKDEDVWAYSPQGASDIVARIVKTDYGFQVYVRGPHGWIAQGQPHKSQEEAEADAKLFFEAIETLDVDQINEEQFLEAMSILELHNEELTEEQLNEILPAVAAGAGAGLGMWGIDQMSKPHEERTWTKLWRKFGPKKKAPHAIERPDPDDAAGIPSADITPTVVTQKDPHRRPTPKNANSPQYQKESEINELGAAGALALGAAGVGAGVAGYKWLKGLKGKTKDQKSTRQANIDTALKDSIDSNPWWRDMDTTLQEMKAEIMETPKKK